MNTSDFKGSALVVLILRVGTLTWSMARAINLPCADPEALGFSATWLDHIDQFYAGEIKRGELAGMVALIARHRKVAHFSAIGFANVEKHRPMPIDTISRLFSMTKPIASTALMMLYEEERFQVKDPLSKYQPEFAQLRVLKHPDGDIKDTVPAKWDPRLKMSCAIRLASRTDLRATPSTHQYQKAGLLGLEVSPAEMVDKLAKLPLHHQPGTNFAYSVGPNVQVRLVEAQSVPSKSFRQ